MAKHTYIISMDEFLAAIPPEQIDELKAVVDIMIRNEHLASRERGIESELKLYFVAAALAFVAALLVLLMFGEPGGFVDWMPGSWLLLTAGLGFLPGLALYYGFRVRKRSRADGENDKLNQKWFVPQGAIYFPSDAPRAAQTVTLINPDTAKATRRKSRFEDVKPGTIW